MEALYLLFWYVHFDIYCFTLKVKEKSFDNVGMSFLLGTTVKMVFLLFDFKTYLAHYNI
jgi:hypothetical protein